MDNNNETNSMTLKGRLLGRILVQMGSVSFDHVHEALFEQGKKGGAIGDVMVNLGIIDRHTRDIALAFQRGMKYMDVSKINIPEKLLEMIPASLAWSYKVLPIGKDKTTNKLMIAFDSTGGLANLDKLKARLKVPIRPIFTFPGQMLQALSRFYGLPDPNVRKLSDSDFGKTKFNPDVRTGGMKKMHCTSCGMEISVAKGVDKTLSRCVNCLGEVVRSAEDETIVKWLKAGLA